MSSYLVPRLEGVLRALAHGKRAGLLELACSSAFSDAVFLEAGSNLSHTMLSSACMSFVSAVMARRRPVPQHDAELSERAVAR
jgi:hypothetical protein